METRKNFTFGKNQKNVCLCMDCSLTMNRWMNKWKWDAPSLSHYTFIHIYYSCFCFLQPGVSINQCAFFLFCLFARLSELKSGTVGSPVSFFFAQFSSRMCIHYTYLYLYCIIIKHLANGNKNEWFNTSTWWKLERANPTKKKIKIIVASAHIL